MTDEIDLDALEQNIQESLDETEETEEVVEETAEEGVETEEEGDAFDLDEAINSFEPVNLTGKITEEQAIEKAKERGWSEDGVDKYGNRITAIEFLERAPFFKRFESLHGKIDAQDRKIEALAEQNKKIAQKSVEDKKKLNEDLKATKDKLLSAEYLDTEDVAKLKDIDSQMEEVSVEDQATEVELSPEDKQLADDYDVAKVKFKEDNEWYEDNYKMTKMADDVGVAYVQNYLETHKVLPPPEETFNHVIDQVRKAYPEEKKPRQTRVASTQNRTVVSQIKKTKTLKDIPEYQRAVAREVMEAAGLSEEQYLKTYEF